MQGSQENMRTTVHGQDEEIQELQELRKDSQGRKVQEKGCQEKEKIIKFSSRKQKSKFNISSLLFTSSKS